MNAEKSSAALSVKSGERVRGYEVKRLPLGEYLRAMEMLREAPQTMMAACFPGESASQVLARLKRIDADGLAALLVQLMGVAPGEAVRLLSVLTGVPEEALLSDPAIGLDGAAEMARAFWRLNGIENFIHAAGELAAKLRAMRAPGAGTGSSGSSSRA